MICKTSEVIPRNEQTAKRNFNNLLVDKCYGHYVVLNFDACQRYCACIRLVSLL